MSCIDCPIDDQPRMAPYTLWLLDTWRTMQRFPGSLPEAGGLLDQEERLMRELGVVAEAIADREPKPDQTPPAPEQATVIRRRRGRR